MFRSLASTCEYLCSTTALCSSAGLLPKIHIREIMPNFPQLLPYLDRYLLIALLCHLASTFLCVHACMSVGGLSIVPWDVVTQVSPTLVFETASLPGT